MVRMGWCDGLKWRRRPVVATVTYVCVEGMRRPGCQNSCTPIISGGKSQCNSVTSVFQSLLLVLAGATPKELARQIKYLKVENDILRGKLPKRITVTAKRKEPTGAVRAEAGGKVLRQLTTIVVPNTLLGWIRAEKKDGKKQPVKRGRRRTPDQIRLLILKLAKENQWGYTRILGELKKLGIRLISRNTWTGS